MTEKANKDGSGSRPELEDQEPIAVFLLMELGHRRAALQQLGNFEPRSSSFSKADADEIAETSGVPEPILRDTFSAARSFHEQGETVDGLLLVLERFCARHPNVDRTAAAIDLNALAQLSDRLDARFDEVGSVSFALPTAETVFISCDLRVLSNPGEELRLRAIAILRVTLDEGPAMTFQCTPLMLARLRSDLAKAESTLRRLEVIADSARKAPVQ